jgi:hypothetical protein
MSENAPRPKLRITMGAFPQRYSLPSRPSGASPSVQDACRQTQFLLGDDLALFERAMDLHLRLVAENARLRTPEAAALFAFWARVFSHLADACTLMSQGAYVSCPPLLRTACDAIAAQRSLIADGFGEYEEWLADAIGQVKERAALAFALGRFRAGSMLAQDPALGAIYRLLTDLSMPHFGATAFLVAPDSNLQKAPLTFGDNAFHLGWAELVTGWLLALAEAQLSTAVSSGVFATSEDAAAGQQAISREVAAALDNPRRCRAQEVDGRFLFHNFRRAATGAPRRVML